LWAGLGSGAYGASAVLFQPSGSSVSYSEIIKENAHTGRTTERLVVGAHLRSNVDLWGRNCCEAQLVSTRNYRPRV
jgi:hypothetical protein